MPLSCDAINDLAQSNQPSLLDMQDGDFTGGNLQASAMVCNTSLSFKEFTDNVHDGNIYTAGSVDEIPTPTISVEQATNQSGGGNKKKRRKTQKRKHKKNKSKKRQNKKRQTRKRQNRKLKNKRKTKSR